MEKNQSPFLAQLRNMQVGDIIEQPLSRRAYIASACTRFALEWERKFSTRTDKDRRVVVVTRIA